MANTREYELKFDLHPSATETLISHPAFRAALPRRRLDQLTSTYFDTPDLALRRRRVALRVRTSALGTTTHTLKAAGRSAVDRDEWEVEDNAARPDLGWLRSTPLQSLFDAGDVAGALDPRFTVDVERTTFPLEMNGTAIEAALDSGTIRTKNLSLSVNELELELKRGSDRDVLKLARRLARDLPLTLSLASKAERGYGVADMSWGRPTKSVVVDLAGVTRLGPAFARVVEACLHALARNAALVADSGGSDVEAVHKTRIALRHLRAAIALFRPVLRRKRVKHVNDALRWMSRLLGEARDADVFQQWASARAGATDEPAGVAVLAKRIQASQTEAHKALHAALGTARWRLLLIDLLEFATNGVRKSARRRRCAPFVRDRLAAHRRALVRSARHMAARSEFELHDLRKRAKMLRYDLDLFAALPKLGLGKKSLRGTGKVLQTLQDSLGELHDEAAVRARLDDLLRDRNGSAGQQPSSPTDLRAAAAHLVSAGRADEAAREAALDAARRLRREFAF